jgi:hypothetical protein
MLTVPSQHGFHVKGHVATIQEASQAEESGDSSATASSTAWDQWRMGCSTAPALAAPYSAGAGVQGLLDLCAHSAMLPMGPEGVPMCSQVEVVGTAHSSNGVRRLVKAVLRGLRACQVLPHPPSHAPASCMVHHLSCDYSLQSMPACCKDRA